MKTYSIRVLIVTLLVAVGLLWSPPQALSQSSGVGTITTVLLDPAPIPGQPVTLRAMVLSVEPSAGVPSGTVEFFDGADSLGTATLADDHGIGMASVTIDLPAGDYSLRAEYSGDYAFAWSASSPSLPLDVLAAP